MNADDTAQKTPATDADNRIAIHDAIERVRTLLVTLIEQDRGRGVFMATIPAIAAALDTLYRDQSLRTPTPGLDAGAPRDLLVGPNLDYAALVMPVDPTELLMRYSKEVNASERVGIDSDSDVGHECMRRALRSFGVPTTRPR